MSELAQKIIIGITSAVGISIISFLTAQFFRIIKEQKSIKKGLKALLRDRIIQIYNYYSEKNLFPFMRVKTLRVYGLNIRVSAATERLTDWRKD